MGTGSSHFFERPATRTGWWSVGLEIAFTLIFIGNIPFNLYVIQPLNRPLPVVYVAFILLMLACGIAGGIVGVLAVTKSYERSLLVWAATLLGVFALLIFLNEMMQGIQIVLG